MGYWPWHVYATLGLHPIQSERQPVSLVGQEITRFPTERSQISTIPPFHLIPDWTETRGGRLGSRNSHQRLLEGKTNSQLSPITVSCKLCDPLSSAERSEAIPTSKSRVEPSCVATSCFLSSPPLSPSSPFRAIRMSGRALIYNLTIKISRHAI